MPIDLSHPVVLHSNKRKFVGLFVLALLFVALGMYVVWRGKHFPSIQMRLPEYIGISFFGLCSIVFAIMTLPGTSYLVLDPQGFSIHLFGRSNFTKWSDISELGAFRTRMSGDLVVGLKYKDGVRISPRLRRWNVRQTGYEDELPDPELRFECFLKVTEFIEFAPVSTFGYKRTRWSFFVDADR